MSVLDFGPAEFEALWLSLKIALTASILSIIPAIAVAHALSRSGWMGRAFLNVIVNAPLVLPAVVIGYLLLVVFGVRGPIGQWLNDVLGIRLVFTTAGAVLAVAVMSFPLMVRAIRLSMDTIDPGLEFAARTLGASRLDVFLTISLPLMLPGILAGFIIAYAASLGEFGATITFAANVVGETRTLPLAIYTAIQTPDGDLLAMRLVILSSVLAVIALALSEFIEQQARRVVYGR
ncbi:MAG: molybdate ABC transporter permease subunit [Hyphomicrobiaceae bacterium]